MKVLSLFDGISGARVALERAGIAVDKYYASEIDKYAVKISQANYPDIIQLGDVEKWQDWGIETPDLIVAGSPCQGFSFAGKQLNFNDPRSALFFRFVGVLKHYKPKWFLLENVKMKKEYQQVITDLLGVEPIIINSALVSAQNRQRLYWTNIPNIKQPKDKGVLLKDIIEHTKNAELSGMDAFSVSPESAKKYSNNKQYDFLDPYNRTEVKGGKSTTLRTNSSNGNMWVGGKQEPNLKYRKLTPLECERLQTFPDSFTNHVSNTQRYKSLGNAFTVDVIAHILRGIIEK